MLEKQIRWRHCATELQSIWIQANLFLQLPVLEIEIFKYFDI